MTMSSTTSPRSVAVFSLGGTIAMTSDGHGGVVPALSGADLLAAVPGLAETGIDVAVHDFRRLPGASLGFDDLLELAAALRATLATGTDGVVVTQGTDTIEETAYLLDLVHDGDAPIAVTGAMRNPTLAGADGPANLLAAIHTAASPQARGVGCVVVFADTIHAARQVCKTHATSITAFTSPNTGPIGHVVEGQPQLLQHPPRPASIDIAPGSTPARVALVPMVLDDDAALLHNLDGRLDGLVVAGFGAGHVPETCVPALTELAARLPVVLASRTGAGPVLTHTYGFTGSEHDLLNRGLIHAGFLDPYKARILLRLLLTTGASHSAITAAFATANGTAPSHSHQTDR